MSELNDLYQEVILDHNKKPRNYGTADRVSHRADGHNPLCGDKISLQLLVDDDGVIRDIRFNGAGCAISTASASIMTESVKGLPRDQVEKLFETFHDLVTGQPSSVDGGPELGKLAVFHGVSEYPVRVKCATLAWHTLQAALNKQAEPVTTE